MNNQIIVVIILIIIAIINCFVIIFIKNHPENISGFKWRETAEDKYEDRKWVNLLVKSISYANIVTFLGGLFSIFLNNNILFYIFVSFPIPFAICYVYCKRKVDVSLFYPKKMTLIVGTITLLLLSFPLLYSYYSDAEVTVGEEYMEIKGVYGEKIKYSDIKSISFARQVPNMKMRINGFALGDTRLGYFLSENNKQVTLFTHSDSCCIKIEYNNNKIIYLNYKTANKTWTTYECIMKKINISR